MKKGLFFWGLFATLGMIVAIFVAVIIGFGSQNLNKDLIIETRSQKGIIIKLNKLLGDVKLNSHGKGRIEKIRETIEDWEDLKEYIKLGIEPDISGRDLSGD